MSKAIAMMLAMILGGHGLLGLFIEGEPFMRFNMDFALDLVHLGSAAVLIAVSRERASDPAVRGGLLLVAGLQIGTGLLGMADRHLLGLAPTGLQEFDFLLTFGLGSAALVGALLPRAERNIWEVNGAAE